MQQNTTHCLLPWFNDIYKPKHLPFTRAYLSLHLKSAIFFNKWRKAFLIGSQEKIKSANKNSFIILLPHLIKVLVHLKVTSFFSTPSFFLCQPDALSAEVKYRCYVLKLHRSSLVIKSWHLFLDSDFFPNSDSI